MTILTSSFYAILQYYNNHHAHIEHTYYNIEQKFCQVKIKTQLFFRFLFVYSNANFNVYKRGFAYILGTILTLKKEVSITFWLKPLSLKFRLIFTSKTQCLCGVWFVQQFGTNHLFFDKNLEYKFSCYIAQVTAEFS